MIEIKEHSGRIAVFLRHAERDKSDVMNVGEDVMLTERGISASRQFGMNLRDIPVRAIYCSPVLRCVQTAKAINEEMSNYATDIVLTNKLGLPGLSIADTGESGPLYEQHTTREIYDRYTQEIEMKALTPPSVLAERTLDFLRSVCKEEGVYLLISHDSVIAHIQYALTGHVYREDEWVDFLDGFVIKI